MAEDPPAAAGAPVYNPDTVLNRFDNVADVIRIYWTKLSFEEANHFYNQEIEGTISNAVYYIRKNPSVTVRSHLLYQPKTVRVDLCTIDGKLSSFKYVALGKDTVEMLTAFLDEAKFALFGPENKFVSTFFYNEPDLTTKLLNYLPMHDLLKLERSCHQIKQKMAGPLMDEKFWKKKYEQYCNEQHIEYRAQHNYRTALMLAGREAATNGRIAVALRHQGAERNLDILRDDRRPSLDRRLPFAEPNDPFDPRFPGILGDPPHPAVFPPIPRRPRNPDQPQPHNPFPPFPDFYG